MLQGGFTEISRKDFSWEDNVDLTLATYEEVIGAQSRDKAV